MTIQISFLGKSQLDSKTGYRSARYRFEDGTEVETAFFGPALACKTKPDRLVLLGTSGSMWDTLLENQVTDGRLEDARLALMDAVRADAATDGHLTPLEPLVEARVGCSVSLRVISYGRDRMEQAEILRTMARTEDLTPGTEVILDVTHGLRHLPMIALAAAYYLEHVNRVRVSEIYYGALEMMRSGVAPVLSLKGLLTAMEWVQALAAYDRDGDYGPMVPLLEQAGVATELVAHLRRAAFAERVFNHELARQNLLPLRDLISQGLPGEAALFTDALGRRIEWSNSSTAAQRLAAIARDRLKHGDHVRAAVAATSAFIASMAKPGERLSNYDTHVSIEAEFREGIRGDASLRPDYELLKRLRNTLVHGTPPKDPETRRTLSDEDRLTKTLGDLIHRLLA